MRVRPRALNASLHVSPHAPTKSLGAHKKPLSWTTTHLATWAPQTRDGLPRFGQLGRPRHILGNHEIFGRPRYCMGAHNVSWKSMRNIGRSRNLVGLQQITLTPKTRQLWTPTHIIGRSQDFVGAHAFIWAYTKSCGQSHDCVVVHETLCASTFMYGRLCMYMGTHKVSWTLTYSHGRSRDFMGAHICEWTPNSAASWTHTHIVWASSVEALWAPNYVANFTHFGLP